MDFNNRYNIFNELFSSLNSCNKWNFYGLENQLFFVKKSITEWANKNCIEDDIKNEMLLSAKTVFKPSYYIIHDDLRYIDINDPSEINQLFKLNHYYVMQMCLFDRLKQLQKMILELIIKRYFIKCYF